MSVQIHEPSEGIRTVDIAGSVMTVKADAGTTGDTYVVAEATLAPGGFEPPLHLHREMAECVYVLSGQLNVQAGDDRKIAVPGTFVGIPAGVPHTMSVVGDEPVRMLMILSNPTRANQMLDTLERVFADGEPDPETAGPLMAQLDMEIVEPAAP